MESNMEHKDYIKRVQSLLVEKLKDHKEDNIKYVCEHFEKNMEKQSLFNDLQDLISTIIEKQMVFQRVSVFGAIKQLFKPIFKKYNIFSLWKRSGAVD